MLVDWNPNIDISFRSTDILQAKLPQWPLQKYPSGHTWLKVFMILSRFIHKKAEVSAVYMTCIYLSEPATMVTCTAWYKLIIVQCYKKDKYKMHYRYHDFNVMNCITYLISTCISHCTWACHFGLWKSKITCTNNFHNTCQSLLYK